MTHCGVDDQPPIWLRMLDAALLIAAANRVELAVAKVRLLNAMSGGIIEFQAFRQMGLELKPITVAMPRGLTLDDIDWNNSRPFAPWEGTGAWKWVSLHPLDLIEVCRADVIRVLCRAGSGQVRRVANAPVLDSPVRRHKRSPEVERANRALTVIYPEGVPDQATVRDNKLNNQVNDWLRDNSLDPVTIDSVLRAAGRRIDRK
jgi:hypothetical protein